MIVPVLRVVRHAAHGMVRFDLQGSNLGALSSKGFQGFQGCIGLMPGVGLYIDSINAHPYNPPLQALCGNSFKF